MRRPFEHIDVDLVPTRLHTFEEVRVWHARRVILDSTTFQEAADRLGITKKTLWEFRKKHGIRERPTAA